MWVWAVGGAGKWVARLFEAEVCAAMGRRSVWEGVGLLRKHTGCWGRCTGQQEEEDKQLIAPVRCGVIRECV